jgi:hypothetical protein
MATPIPSVEPVTSAVRSLRFDSAPGLAATLGSGRVEERVDVARETTVVLEQKAVS